MKSITKALAKGSLATVAAGAVAVSSAAPANAQDRYRDYDDDGISAGEVIAGAVVLGGIAAILSSGNRDRYRDDYRYNDRRGSNYYGNRGYNGYGARAAVDQCVRAAEQQAQRYTGARAEVYEVRDIDRERDGFEVKGRIAVQDRWGGGRYGDYRRGYRNSGWDEGTFNCDVRRGRIVDLDFGGIRGL